MTDNTAKPIETIATSKPVPAVVNANHHSVSGRAADVVPPTNVAASVDLPSSAGDAGRKKSGFVITRVDKASNSATILENESDFENEINDHGAYVAGGCASSPGSSSIMSEASTVDGGSLEKPWSISRAPPPTPAGATPTSPAWPASQHHQRTGGLTAIITANSAVAGAAALLSAAASLGQHPAPMHQVQQAVVIASQSPSAAPPATISRETSASSRFHIIKIETGPYKRGRWNCRDFDESASGSGSGASRSDMIAVGPRSGGSSNSSGRPSFHIIADENGHGAGDHTSLLAAASDHSTNQQQTFHQVGSLASKPPLPTGHHHHHHHRPPQQHSPSPATLPQGQQAKSVAQNADHGSAVQSSISTGSAGPPRATVVKQASVTSQPQQQPASVSTSNSTPLSNIAQERSRQRSQSPVVAAAPSGAAASATAPAPPTTISRFQVRPAAVDLNNAAAAILDSIVGSMQNDNNRMVIGAGGRQQASAITSSSTGSATVAGATAIASVVDGPIGGGSGGARGMGQAAALAPGSVGANVVAIDNKIEQAMDLVKTHLLYAVREEVEVLKEKIIDLEKKVFRLETENKLLREYAPPEILQQIQHQHHQHQQPLSSASGAASAFSSQTNSTTSSSSTAQQQQPTAISIAQQQSSQPSVTQAAPIVTTQQSVHGSAAANVNTPVTTAASAALSSSAAQHQQQQ